MVLTCLQTRVGKPPASLAEPFVAAAGLTVRYGDITALDNVSFSFGTGVIGLVGPNGAGKSTLISTLAGALRPSEGRAVVLGKDTSHTGDRSWRRRVGYLPQRFDLASGMSVVDTVRYAAWCNGVKRADLTACAMHALELVDLVDRRRFRARRLSGGQRQRLGLAASIAHDPSLILLDEPTAGLDPQQRVRFREYVGLIGQERSVLLATHLLEDIQNTASHILVLSHGRVVFDGDPQDLERMGRDVKRSHASSLELGYTSVLEEQTWPE